ncbi:MAG: type II toxin-antitoxin system RelE/ParE family toxin [Proteobacteria bacterium]|nr:type II toxin-antitoxin system RelE/ParE family toxin [Pseudomonadota bacterium]
MLERIDSLAGDPRPSACKKLSSEEVFRSRQGGYRIIYEIFDDRLVVLIVAEANRAVAYRNL